jgi:hypothetical protein
MKKLLAVPLAALAVAVAAQDGSGVSLGRIEDKAAILTLSRAARVSVIAESSIGVPIGLEDKMEGRIASGGAAGKLDGRIDVTLDPGEYRVRIEADDAPGKSPRLAARGFRELGGDKQSSWPRLIPGQVASAALGDLQSASYWIELREDGAVEVEALGRDLAVLEVWREGQYLLGSYPVREERQLEEGRPMGYACASIPAKAGRYLARLYGGPSRPWAKDEGKRPLHVRSGFIGMPVGGRLDLAVSPFGRDFILARGFDSACLSTADEGLASISAAGYAPGGDRLRADDRALIAKGSIERRAALRFSAGAALLSVEAKPGQAVGIDACRYVDFQSYAAIDPRSGGLLSIIASRSSSPELPVTALVYRVSDGKAVVAKDYAAPLSRSASFRGRCNLRDGSARSVFLRVEEAGDYQIAEKDGKGQADGLYDLVALGPDLSALAQVKDRAPAWGETYSLSRGYYALLVSAQSFGVLDFAVQRAGVGRISAALGKDPAPARMSLSCAFDADPSAKEIRVAVAGGPSGGSGYSFAPYPVALDAGLSLELGARESFELPSSVARRSTFHSMPGQAAVLMGGQSPVEGGVVTPAGRTLSLRNATAATVQAAFSLPAAFDDLPAPQATAFGSGTTALASSAIDWRDFARSGSAVYSFEVIESAVYVIETLGRLSTSLSLRTASRPEIVSASANGYGRNAAIRAWLRPGQYYVTASATGLSAGRCGVRMGRVPLAAEVPLALGAVDRRAVPADSAARFAFALDGEREVEIDSAGLAGSYQIRLEDEDSFIVYRGEGRARLELGAGRYRLYSLPVSIETNRLTWIEDLEPGPPRPAVPGTKGLALNASASSVWREGSEPDRWSFSVPSRLEARLGLPPSFAAFLDGPGGKRAVDAASGPIVLERGAYTLSLRPRDAADQLPYSVSVSTAVLAPGVGGISVPGSKRSSGRVSVPEDGFYELWSLGRSDLSATLVREDSGAVAARSDDNGPDWNFDIVQRLKAGYYRLEIESLAGSSEEVSLRLASRDARTVPAVAAPYEGRIKMGEAGVFVPFDTKAGEGLYLLEAAGDPATGVRASLRLYRGDELIAAGEGRIAVPLRGSTRYAIYAWTPIASEPKLAFKRLAEKDASMSSPFSLKAGEAARLRNPQAMSATAVSGSILASSGLESPCRDPGRSAFSTLDSVGWAWAPEEGCSIAPLTLSEEEGAVLSLSDVGQGFAASSPDQALLVSVDTRGQFRCGVSAKIESGAGAAAYDWDASATWSQGSAALLPPGSWKARIWDGERAKAAGIERRVGVGLDFLAIESLEALKMGGRATLSVPALSAISMEVPACTLSLLLGEGLVLSAWKDGEALATVASLDGRVSDTLALKASRLYVANRGASAVALRVAVLPARAQEDDELSASRPFEAVDLVPEGARLELRAAEGELLCLAGESCEATLETVDGRYVTLVHDPAAGLFSSVAASSGKLRVRSASGGLVRAYLAKAGKEVDGLVAQAPGPARDLSDAAVLTGKGDAFRLRMAAAGYVDLSCPGPGVLALAGAGIERRVAVSGSRDDMHLFAWLPAGDYSAWQRPARSSAGGGIIRADRVESRDAAEASGGRKAFIGAREYQAWSFEVKVAGKVGIGIKADADGLRGFVYDARQGLVASGPLSFAELEAGAYLLVVKGLDSTPIEYELALEGLDGSRLGVPPEVVKEYEAEGGPPASIAVPMRSRGSAPRASNANDGDGGDGEYVGEGEYEGGGDIEGGGEYEGDGDYESEGEDYDEE